MRTLNVVFEDKEYEQLEKRKGESNWHDFILTLTKRGVNQMNEQQLKSLIKMMKQRPDIWPEESIKKVEQNCSTLLI